MLLLFLEFPKVKDSKVLLKDTILKVVQDHMVKNTQKEKEVHQVLVVIKEFLKVHVWPAVWEGIR
jgi:hypothetical protein